MKARRAAFPGLLILVAFGVSPRLNLVAQDENEASQVFRKAEAKLTAARTLRAEVTVLRTTTFLRTGSTIADQTQVRLILERENKCHLWMTEDASPQSRGGLAPPESTREIVSDGKGMRLRWPQLPSEPRHWTDQATPKGWNDALLKGLVHVRAGGGFGVSNVRDDTAPSKERRAATPERWGLPRGFKLGGREKAGGRDVVVVEYTVSRSAAEDSRSPVGRFTIWLDEATLLPIKRVMKESGGSMETVTSETITALELDGSLPSGVFDLPKDDSPAHAEPPASDRDLELSVEAAVKKLSSDDPAVRESAAAELSKSGRRAIALIAPLLRADDAEVAGRIGWVIEQIYCTDPFYLARPPARRRTAHLRDVPLRAALKQLFEPFHAAPRMDPPTGDQVPARVSLDLNEASFWETVRAFERASRSHFNPAGFKGEPEFQYEESTSDRIALSKDHPDWATSARATRTGGEVRISLLLCGPPECLPISASLEISSLRDDREKEVRELFKERAPAEGPEKKRAQSPNYHHLPKIPLGEFAAAGSALRAGSRLNLEGKVRVLLPADVQAAEFRVAGFGGDEQKALGDLLIRVTRLEPKGDALRISDGYKGSSKWQPGKDREYEKVVWIVLADDRGRSVFGGSTEYTASGSAGWDVSWPFTPEATRLTYLRPTRADLLDFPVRIEGIEVTEEK